MFYVVKLQQQPLVDKTASAPKVEPLQQVASENTIEQSSLHERRRYDSVYEQRKRRYRRDPQSEYRAKRVAKRQLPLQTSVQAQILRHEIAEGIHFDAKIAPHLNVDEAKHEYEHQVDWRDQEEIPPVDVNEKI